MPVLNFEPKDVHEFQPILAEIEDQPRNPLAPATFWLTFTTAAFFVLWSIFGEVDVVVSAPGKVIPEGHAKILQPLETGVVSNIFVKEGDHVRKGQPLIEIDPSMTADELQATQANYQHTRMEMQRIHSALSSQQEAVTTSSLGRSFSTQIALQTASVASLQKQLEAKAKEQLRVQQQRKQTEAELEKNKRLLAQSTAKHERLAPVLDLIARDEWDRNESDITTYTSNISEQEARLVELTHQDAELAAEIERIKFDFQTTNLQDLSEKEKQATELHAQVRQLSFKHRKQLITAPADGLVDELFIHTVGGVVTSGEKLLSIVPSDQRLLVQTDVANRDIGFVRAGMNAQLKVDTFDFQKYGMFAGKVVLVSSDSHDNELRKPVVDRDQSEKKLEQVFEVQIQPTTKFLLVDGKQERLIPGMTVTAEIKTGKRRIIEFFIYPLIKYWHNGITVR